MRRPSWDDYFLEITRATARRSTCLRRKVGCVIVKDKRLLATGYNGAPSGLLHCEEVGCLREKLNIPSGERQEICRGLHAEQNAIIQASIYGVSLKDTILYSTNQPCVTCAKMLIQAGVKKIIFAGDYPDEIAISLFQDAQIELIKIE